ASSPSPRKTWALSANSWAWARPLCHDDARRLGIVARQRQVGARPLAVTHQRSISCLGYRRPAAAAPDRPVDAVALHHPRDRTTDVAVENRPPGHEGELPGLFDQRDAPRGQVDRTAVDALDTVARPALDIAETEFVREGPGDAAHLAPPELGEHVAAIDDLALILLGQLLAHEPAHPAGLRRCDLLPEPRIARRLGRGRNQFAVEPGRAVEPGLSFKRDSGKRSDDHRRGLGAPGLERRRPRDMI